MFEPQRRAYLQAMGVNSYAPRFILANAATSKRCVGLPAAAPEAPRPAPPAAVQSASTAMNAPGAAIKKVGRAAIDMPELAVAGADSRRPKKTPAPTTLPTTEAVAFNAELVSTALGLLFLSDAPLDPPHKRLLANIALAYSRHACDGRDSGLQGSRFQWPVSRGLPQGADAARDALSASVLAKVERQQLRVLLVFGDRLLTYLDGEMLEKAGLRIIAAEPLAELFTNAAAKAALWHALRALPLP